MSLESRSFSIVGGLVLLGLFLFPGCDSAPTDVGGQLLGAAGGEPVTISLPPSRFENQSDPDITGGSGSTGAERALAGVVNDPALGMIEAKGNIDFSTTASRSDEFASSSLSMAELTLDLDYVYGDTLTMLTLQLSDIIDDWSSLGITADSSVQVGAPVMELQVEPRSQILRFDLPEEWIQENDEVLRSDNFNSLFHGFQLTTLSGNAVIGIHYSASTLKLAVPGDTAIFQMSKVMSSLEKTRLDPPQGRHLIQDGTDSRIEVDFELDIEPLDGNLIHRSIFRITADTPALETPIGFYRPEISTLIMTFVSGDPKLRILVATADVGTDGLVSFDDLVFNNILKSVVLGSLEKATFEISVPVSEATLDVLMIQDTLSVSPPRALLTVTNIN